MNTQELPKEPERSTKTVRDRKEASYTVTVTVINPMIPKREEYLPTTEDVPKYPESILNDFGNSENFVPLSRNLEFIDYQNAQIILTGVREVRAILTQELWITVENEDEDERSADIFTRSKIRNDQVTIKPLMQRKLG